LKKHLFVQYVADQLNLTVDIIRHFVQEYVIVLIKVNK